MDNISDKLGLTGVIFILPAMLAFIYLMVEEPEGWVARTICGAIISTCLGCFLAAIWTM